jgi:DNA-binding NtrC family response regulator
MSDLLKILLAVKEPEKIFSLLKEQNAQVLSPGEDLIGWIKGKSYDAVVLEAPLGLVNDIKAADPRIEIVLIESNGIDVIEALREGVFAYLTSPVQEKAFGEALSALSELVSIRKETGQLEKLLHEKYTFAGAVGRNPLMLDIFSFIRRLAPYYRTLIIEGETGTGKEVVAKALHETSPVRNEPLLFANCGSMMESLIESELFGHRKGSFTGAVTDKAGLFEAAGEGTLVLDEIGELPLSFQPHLLRVLESGDFRRIGANQAQKARCRVIAITNRNLEEEIKKGRFREDLYFRLARLKITVPPLRDRKDDIPLLCRNLLLRFNRRTGKIIYGISRNAQTALMMHDWPGNVRELENVLEEAGIMTTQSFIRMEDLPPHIARVAEKKAFSPFSLDESQKRHIEAILQECKGNRTKAARILNISRRALIRRIQKFNLN